MNNDEIEVITMRFSTKDVTWYEDGGMLEFWIGEGRPEDRQCQYCSLEDAIDFAWKNKVCLYIQTAEQDAGLFVDYTEE